MALWREAGGPAFAADTAAAIAQAESDGCQYALAGPFDIRPVKVCRYTKTDKENSCGLWQINLMAHPTYHAPAIFDPLTNARAAVAISANGTSFVPWTTYGNGAYKQFLTAGVPGADVGPIPNDNGLIGYKTLQDALARQLPSAFWRSQRLGLATSRKLARR